MAVKIKNSQGEWIIDQKAIQTSIVDLEGNFESTNVEGALRELSNKINNQQQGLLIEEKVERIDSNLMKKTLFAKDFGILGQGEDYTEGMTALQDYLNNNRVDEVIFEPNGVVYTDVNLRVSNCKLNGMGTTLMPIEQSWLFHNQKALIILVDNAECTGFHFNGNYKNNYYEQDGKIYYSGASSTTALVVAIGCTGTWIIGDHCSCHHNTYTDMQWTCIDVNGKSKPSGRNRDVDIYSNIFHNSGEDHVAIHSSEDVRVHHNYSYDASNHAVHPYSFVKNVRIYDNYISITKDNIIEWNEDYVKNSQRTAFIIDHPQYPQSEVYNVIIENNLVVGEFKAGVELTGYADCYKINNNEFIGDGTNIGVRYKTITLRDSYIKCNRFKNLSKCFSINTISGIAKPTYDTRVEGSVLIEDNGYTDCTTAYEMFAVADIEGIETFTMICKNNNYYNISKPANIQTMLTNFHLEIYDKDVTFTNSTFNGNTLYTRESSIRLKEGANPNILPYDFSLRDSTNGILGFITRSKVNTGITTTVDYDDTNECLTINTSEGDMKSYTYAQILYNSNPLINYDLVTMNMSFSCESSIRFYFQIQMIDFEDNVVNRVTVIDKELVAGETYETWNIFKLSQYNFNSNVNAIRLVFQFGNSESYGQVTNFKLHKFGMVENIMYKIPYDIKKYTASDLDIYIKPKTYYGSNPPSSGSYRKGTVVVNNSPSEGSFSGWICSKGGSPGDWLGYGEIAKNSNIFPHNFDLRDSEGNIPGLNVRNSTVVGGVTTLTSDSGTLIANLSGDNIKSFTNITMEYPHNPLAYYNYVYFRVKFSCETSRHIYLMIRVIDGAGSIIKSLTLIDMDMESGVEYTQVKGFNLSNYQLNSNNYSLVVYIQLGNSNDYGEIVNFKLNEIGFTTSYIDKNSIVEYTPYSLTDMYKYIAPRELYGTSYPTSGIYKKGTRIVNINPTSGKYVGWVCVTSGSPGEWKGYGLIE